MKVADKTRVLSPDGMCRKSYGNLFKLRFVFASDYRVNLFCYLLPSIPFEQMQRREACSHQFNEVARVNYKENAIDTFERRRSPKLKAVLAVLLVEVLKVLEPLEKITFGVDVNTGPLAEVIERSGDVIRRQFACHHSQALSVRYALN